MTESLLPGQLRHEQRRAGRAVDGAVHPRHVEARHHAGLRTEGDDAERVARAIASAAVPACMRAKSRRALRGPQGGSQEAAGEPHGGSVCPRGRDMCVCGGGGGGGKAPGAFESTSGGHTDGVVRKVAQFGPDLGARGSCRTTRRRASSSRRTAAAARRC